MISWNKKHDLYRNVSKAVVSNTKYVTSGPTLQQQQHHQQQQHQIWFDPFTSKLANTTASQSNHTQLVQRYNDNNTRSEKIHILDERSSISNNMIGIEVKPKNVHSAHQTIPVLDTIPQANSLKSKASHKHDERIHQKNRTGPIDVPQSTPNSLSVYRPFQDCPEPLVNVYCLNGGQCFRVDFHHNHTFACRCADGYGGIRCEYKTPNLAVFKQDTEFMPVAAINFPTLPPTSEEAISRDLQTIGLAEQESTPSSNSLYESDKPSSSRLSAAPMSTSTTAAITTDTTMDTIKVSNPATSIITLYLMLFIACVFHLTILYMALRRWGMRILFCYTPPSDKNVVESPSLPCESDHSSVHQGSSHWESSRYHSSSWFTHKSKCNPTFLASIEAVKQPPSTLHRQHRLGPSYVTMDHERGLKSVTPTMIHQSTQRDANLDSNNHIYASLDSRVGSTDHQLKPSNSYSSCDSGFSGNDDGMEIDSVRSYANTQPSPLSSHFSTVTPSDYYEYYKPRSSDTPTLTTLVHPKRHPQMALTESKVHLRAPCVVDHNSNYLHPIPDNQKIQEYDTSANFQALVQSKCLCHLCQSSIEIKQFNA